MQKVKSMMLKTFSGKIHFVDNNGKRYNKKYIKDALKNKKIDIDIFSDNAKKYIETGYSDKKFFHNQQSKLF